MGARFFMRSAVSIGCAAVLACEVSPGHELGESASGGDSAVPAPWLDENFNRYLPVPGVLGGPGRWTPVPGSENVQLVGDDGCGVMAGPDPVTVQAAASKDVPDQASGIHHVEFDVKVDTEVREPSVGKFVVNGNVGGDGIKFQFIAGTGLRVAWGQQPDQSYPLVGQMKPFRWYHVRAEVTLPGGNLDVYVDGQLANDRPLTPRAGAITAVTLVGFVRDGVTYFDNLYGAPIRGSTWVNIDAPTPSSTVSGVVPIAVSASPDVTSVQLFVEGQPKGDPVTRAPFAFQWNSAENPLPAPAPGHDIESSYYFADGRYGDYRKDVNHYTDGYFAWARIGYIQNAEEPPLGPWVGEMARALLDAGAQGRRITLELNLQDPASNQQEVIDKVLEIARPVWSHVERIELADEPDWKTADQAEDMIQYIRGRMDLQELPDRPMGIAYSFEDPYPDTINAPSLAWLGIETYRDGPGHPVSQVNIDGLRAQVGRSMDQVPQGKEVVFIPQAYTRNSCWGNIDNVRDLQSPTYLLGAADSRVVGMNMFAYARSNPFKPTSTLQNPELREPHILAGELILDRNIQSARGGLRTISVRATGSGGVVWARRVVTVGGPIVHAPLAVPGNTAGLLARVIRKPAIAVDAWSMTGGSITAGANTHEVTFTSGPPGTAMELALSETYLGSRQVRHKLLADFRDVPPTHGFHDYIANVALNAVASGCGGGNYCPELATTREQMAVFLLRAAEGPTYQPPPASGAVFQDVPATSPFAAWIEELARRGVVSGCSSSPPLYCPTAPVSREQMAVFLLVTRDGPGHPPPDPTGIFADVPRTNPFARWIEELYRRGISGGCGSAPLRYCPADPVTRGQMAVFLVKTFRLPFP